jgi:hypothetical protein
VSLQEEKEEVEEEVDESWAGLRIDSHLAGRLEVWTDESMELGREGGGVGAGCGLEVIYGRGAG